MLSPKARNRVALMRGTWVTATCTLHVAVCAGVAASRAVQVLVVVPTGNAVPDPGAHVVVTGAVPPLAVGAAKLTATGVPSTDWAATADGQASVSVAGGVGGVGGAVGEPPQDSPRQASATARMFGNRLLKKEAYLTTQPAHVA